MPTPNTTPYKPSPLSFGSPRTSPFRRQSIASNSSTVIRPNAGSPGSSRGTTPTHSPTKPTQLHSLENNDDVFSTSNGYRPLSSGRELQPSPTKGASTPENRFSVMGSKILENKSTNNDLLTKLPPAQLREMREAFQVLDRDNDGLVTKEDVAYAIGNLGEDSSAAAVAAFFPPNSSTINLPTYLNKIATLLAPLSSSQELLNAFGAFDEDDSGQIDIAELRDALLHTSPEGGERELTEHDIEFIAHGFIGKRAFGTKGNRNSSSRGSQNRAEVFRYQDFVEGLTGGANAPKGDKS
ncbi:hypothetical protein FQN57_000482 [Myotisia sp. PD_48]|nr:hypothetical protein FQN57_000482 [Myotisia sp. PD_48]